LPRLRRPAGAGHVASRRAERRQSWRRRDGCAQSRRARGRVREAQAFSARGDRRPVMHLASRPRAAPMRSITAATADLIGCRVAAKFGAEGKHTMARSMGASACARVAAWFALFFVCSAAAQSLAPDIVVVKTINAPVADVWKAWTTAEGIESFFAPKAAKVEPWPGGAFELRFGVEMPEGSRGSEGCKVQSVKPMEQFVFEWNAPPTIPAIRPLRTLVYLDFKALP